MSETEEKKVEKIISDLELRFKSGNPVAVERGHLNVEEFATLKAFVVAELRRRQSSRAWADIADRQM